MHKIQFPQKPQNKTSEIKKKQKDAKRTNNIERLMNNMTIKIQGFKSILKYIERKLI